MGIVVDFSGVSSSFDPIDPGTYNAVVYDVKLQESKMSGQPMLAWQFKITDGPFENRRAFLNTSLQKQALFKLQRTLKAIGYEKDVTGQVEIDLDELLGRPCRIVIGHQKTPSGEVRDTVTAVLPPSKTEESALNSLF